MFQEAQRDLALIGRQVGFCAAAAVIGAIALIFAGIGGAILLSAEFGPGVAYLCVAGGFLLLALALVLVANAQQREESRPSASAPVSDREPEAAAAIEALTAEVTRQVVRHPLATTLLCAATGFALARDPQLRERAGGLLEQGLREVANARRS